MSAAAGEPSVGAVVPLRAAGGRGPLVVFAQRGSFRILWLCERLVVLDDSLDLRAAALLHPLQIHHVGRHAGELVRHADLTGGGRADGSRGRLIQILCFYK